MIQNVKHSRQTDNLDLRAFYKEQMNCANGGVDRRRKDSAICSKMVVTVNGNEIFLGGVLLTVHLSIFISLLNQIEAQNLFHNKFYFMPLHVSSTCAHHQEAKTALHSLWYHQTYRCDDTRGCVMQF